MPVRGRLSHSTCSLWPFDALVIARFGDLAIWRFGDLAAAPFDDFAIVPFHHLVVWRIGK